MDKRIFSFLLLAMAILTVNSMIQRMLFPPPPQPAVQEQAADEKKADGDAAQKPADGQPGEVKPADVKPGDAPAAQPPAEEKTVDLAWTTLGSLDHSGPYRVLVTLCNRGAVVESAELNNPRYHYVDNVDPLGGYLGHLSQTDAPEGKGVVVNVVGPGTPAAAAGLQVGDVITAVNAKPVTDLVSYDAVMSETEPNDKVAIDLQRDGKSTTAEATLRQHPVQVVQREAHDRSLPALRDQASFLLTLDRIGDQTLELDKEELPGVNLRDANWELLANDPAKPDTAVFRRVLAEQNVEVTKTYTLLKADDQAENPLARPYTLVLNVQVKNLAEEARTLAYRLDGPTGLPVEGPWYARGSKSGSEWFTTYGMRDVVHGLTVDERVDHATQPGSSIAKGEADLVTDPIVDYVGVDSQYFAAVVMPQPPEPTESKFSKLKPIVVGPVVPDQQVLADVTFRLVRKSVEAEPNAVAFNDEYKIYLGPKVPEMLAEYDLAPLVYYGWFDWVAKPMLVVLHFLYGIVGNYGIAIILLTILVRSAMFPLSRKQALNAMKMQELQPEIKRIAEKYKSSPEQRMKAQQELFRKHNYNPFSGCLPIFIQLPIFVGLYRSLAVDVELRQAPLISENIRWASNLAAPDMFWYWEPYLPAFLAGENGFLGPFLNLLPLITILLFIVQQKMFMPPPTDEQSAMQQKMMKYMMIFMGFMFFKVPAGLCVYFITSSVWGIAERKLLPKAKPKEPVAEAVLNVESRSKGGSDRKSKRR